MNPNLKSRISLIVFIIIISFSNAFAQVRPLVGQCTVYSISTSYINAGSGAGQLNPTISVTSQNNCTTYTLSKNGSWLSYSQNGLSVTISVQANTGAARDGYVYIGGSFTVTVHQACGNVAVAPMRLSVDRNNFCSNAGGNITLNAIGGSGDATRWFSGSCDGTQVGYTDASSISIAAPTSTTTYYARWETSCNNSICRYITVNVNQLPVLSISGTTPVCIGSTYTYTTNAGLSGYTWSLPSGASGSSTTNTINVTFGSNGGTISVYATDGNGCVSQPSSMSVSLLSYTIFSMSGGGATCPGTNKSVTLSGSTVGFHYRLYFNGVWQMSDTKDGNGSSITWLKSAGGTYTVIAEKDLCLIPMEGSVVITNPSYSTNPTGITASPASPVCRGTSTNLTVNGGALGEGASWKWYTGGCGSESGGTLVGTGNSYSVNNPQSTTTYWVRAEGTCNNTICVNSTITVITPPVITQHPTSVLICDGAPTSFSVSASGSNTYQWQTNTGGQWANISGATGTTYSIASTTGMDGRGFKCNVTNTCFTTTSNTAYIQFSTSTLFEVTGSATICPGSSSEIKLTGSISGTTYNLYLNGSSAHQSVTGNGGEITFGNKSSAGIYTVKAVTSIGCEFLMYGSATIIEKTPSTPATSISATQTSICPGGNPGGGSTLTLQGGSLETGYGVWHWYSGDGSTQCGNTAGEINTTSISVSPNMTTTYSVRAEGGCVTTLCANVQVNVKPLPTITSQPVNSNVTLGNDATFSVTATGPGLSYQWQVSPNGADPWTDLTGLPAQNYLTANLTIKGSTTFEDNYYQCRVASDCSTIYSSIVKIVLQFPESGYLTSIPDPETRTLNTSYLVGATSGSLNVNPLGGASYTIPIDLPAGVNGLTPGLSLVYSSSSRSGIAGYGWQIDGLSSISRGPQTIYNDGNSNGVNLDINDRFYLDGQRLVNTSSTYGDPSAQYQTENDIFTRVTPQSTDANGPAWFKAETKSGLIYEYGNISVAKQKISGFSQVVNWYVSKVIDLFGNNINFTYIQDHSSVYPSEITYGPSTNPKINTITFYYKQRSDKNTSFLKGAKIEQWLLLDKLIVKYNSNIIKTYEFKQSYQGSSYNSFSVLNEIIEYGIGSSRLNSTAISYKIPANSSFVQTTYNTTHQYVNYNSRLVPGDYNGDGKMDFLCLPDASKGATWTGMRIYFGDGNDNFPTYISSTNSIDLAGLKDIYSCDLNGDGKDDILYEVGDQNVSVFSYMLCNENSISDHVVIYGQVTDPNCGFFGKHRRTVDMQENDNVLGGTDFNGDGVNDIFINSPDGTWAILSFVNTTHHLTSTLNTLASGTLSSLATAEILTGDFNGDGKSEIWAFSDSDLKIYSFSDNNLNLLITYTFASRQHFFTLGDFNGDGKVDMFLYGYGRNGNQLDWPDWHIRLSTGTGFEDHYFTQKKSNLKNDYVRIGDFNGDGESDIMVTSADMSWNGTYFYISENNGTDFYVHSIPSYPVASHKFSLGDFNGDGRTDFICTDGQPAWWTGYQVYRDTTSNPTLLANKIANGLGALTKVVFTKLSQAPSSVYIRGTGATYPVTDFQGPLAVVSSIQLDNGKGSMNTQNYYYEGAKIQLHGKGFLGYAKTKVTDVSAGIESESISGYDNAYYYPQLLSTSSKLVGSNDTIEETTNTWVPLLLDETTKRIFPYVASSIQTNHLTGHIVTLDTEYDPFGNPRSIIKGYSNGPIEIDSINYDNTVSTSKWLLGRPILTKNRYFDSDTTIIRSGTRVFDQNNNHLSSETWYSGTSNEISKSYIYNPNGTLKKETSTANSSSRSNSYSYESDSIRLYITTDYLLHAITKSYDTKGRLYTTQDYLGNTLTYQYDDLGRPYSVSSTNGEQNISNYVWEDPTSTPKFARYSILKTSNDGGQTKSYHDKLGREIRSDVTGFDGSIIHSDTKYNSIAQIDSLSDPFFSSETPAWSTFVYDSFGRKTNLNRPSGKNSVWEYENNSSKILETTGGESSYKIFASNGALDTSWDEGGTITYTYYPDGKVKTITGPGGTSSVNYDLAGNQKKLVDPSVGTVKYVYNGFGELISQENPGSKIITLNYKTDGRISYKTTPEGTTKYRYNNDKKLINIASPNNVSRSFGYDSQGRLISIIDTLPESERFITSLTYDNLGRRSIITHPSGIIETNNYNSNGYLVSISTGSITRWTINSMNARQQITSGRYGSNLSATFSYDDYGNITSSAIGTIQDYSYNFNPLTGNLNWRENNKHTNLREDFQYDNLNRLTNVQKDTATLVMSYNSTGSIESKSDIGTFNYTTSGKPYSVTSIDPYVGPAVADTQIVNYTSFEKISHISEKNIEADIIYNYEDDRTRMVVKQSGIPILTRWYPNNGYIKEYAGGNTKEYTFIGGDAYSAPVVAVKCNNSTIWYYLIRDHLGSITHIVDSSNMVIAEYSFDAWGRMRNPVTWKNYELDSIPTLLIAGRGFTGHEHLPWFNLINMNGRIYDPLYSMFLSPDVNVQSPDYSIGFNRYGYCFNNPLTHNDINGEWALIDDLTAMGLGGIINLGSNLLSGNIHNLKQAGGYFLSGMASGEATLYGGPLAGAAVQGFGNNIVSQVSQKGWKNLNWGQAGTSAVTGMATSYVGGLLSDAISPLTDKILSGVTNKIMYNALDRGISNGIAGFGVSTGVSLIGGNDIHQALRDGVKGAEWGMGFGLMSGSIEGYKLQKAQEAYAQDPIQKLDAKWQSPYSKGEEGVNRALQEISSQGGKVLGREITLEVNGIRVRVDIAADFNGEIQLIEVKNGPSAGFTPNQNQVYRDMLYNKPMIIFRGNNAFNAGFAPGSSTTIYVLRIIKYN